MLYFYVSFHQRSLGSLGSLGSLRSLGSGACVWHVEVNV